MPLQKKVAELQAEADHELFLQAFEKPTQIYRYLRTRSILSPIFLQRTLYYMKNRMSRTHKNRLSFRLNHLLNKVEQKRNEQSKLPGSYLNISFSGFFDKKLDVGQGDLARVEVYIIKVCHKKRKEASAPQMQACVGNQDVSINPTGTESGLVRSSSFSIPVQQFNSNNGSHMIKTFLLQFRVQLMHDQENSGEPMAKRRRVSRSATQESQQQHQQHQDTSLGGNNFKAELVVYDRHGRCQLSPGCYELLLEPMLPGTKSSNSPRKHASWEGVEDLKVEADFHHFQSDGPTLQFSLVWTQENPPLVPTAPRPCLRPLQPLDLLLANSSANKPKLQGVCSPEAPQMVLYQFVYNNNSRQQTEARRDFHCPWCSLNCLALYCLLKHLKLCHARFSFTYVPHTKGARIDVALNECYDGSYAGNPQDLVTVPAGFVFSRSGPTRRTPTTTVLVCRPKRLKPSLSEFLQQDDSSFDLPRSYILGHNRLYHHTMTCLPIGAHELDEDSEGEHDSEWVRAKTATMIDEFSDVNEGEKMLMKMWNMHVMKYNFVGDCQIALACSMFLENHGLEILKKNLYKNFILHMTSLHDFGLIGSGVIYNCVLQLQAILQKSSCVQEQLSTYWEQQRAAGFRAITASPVPFSPNQYSKRKCSTPHMEAETANQSAHHKSAYSTGISKCAATSHSSPKDAYKTSDTYRVSSTTRAQNTAHKSFASSLSMVGNKNQSSSSALKNPTISSVGSKLQTNHTSATKSAQHFYGMNNRSYNGSTDGGKSTIAKTKSMPSRTVTRSSL